IGFLESHELTAQLIQPQRMELKMTWEDKDFYVVSAGEKGIILFRPIKKRNFSEGTRDWEIIRMDTSLQEVWKMERPIKSYFELSGYAANEEAFYLLFEEGSFSKDNFRLYKFSYDQEVMEVAVDKPFPVTLERLEIMGDNLLLGGNTKNRPVVMHFNLQNKKVKVLQGVYKDRSKLTDLSSDKEKQFFTVLLQEKGSSGNSILTVNSYNAFGKHLNTSRLTAGEDRYLLSGEASTFNGGNQVIAGPFSNGNQERSRGLAFFVLDRGQLKVDKIHSYGAFTNYFNYLKENRAQKLKEKADLQLKSGKMPKIDQRVWLHDMVEREGNYYLLGEIYDPKYSREQSSRYFMMPSFYRRRINFNDNKTFEGFEYSHGFIACFNERGELLWDNVMKIDDLKSFYLKEHIFPLFYKDLTALMYKQSDEIHVKLIKGNEVLQKKEAVNIKLKHETDELRNNDDGYGQMEPWYGDYFFVYGVQRVNRNDSESSGTRKVFYINKVSYNFEAHGMATNN
ncbi:hypothetical protein, partial [Xanthovirga aplysinae]|uniref:hypothetical protein n=1 Tax=Xanthovirga aplysinae TaxID=2529853 RepID=UPI0016569A57